MAIIPDKGILQPNARSDVSYYVVADVCNQ